MRSTSIAAFLLFVCCAAPPKQVDPDRLVSERYAPVPAAPAEVSAEAVTALSSTFTSLAGKQELLQAQLATEQPEQVLADSELSVTIVGHYGAAQTRDRSWIVQAGPNTKLLAYRSTNGPAGAALNIRGWQGTDILQKQLTLPHPVSPGDALVVVSGSPPGTFSTTDEAMAVVFVPYPVHPGLLRPPAIGDGFLPRFFRMSPIPESAVDMGQCPTKIDLAAIYKPAGPIDPNAWAAQPPTIAGMLGDLGKFSGEVVDGWPVHSYAPSKQHRGYGTFYAGQISTALCLVCSTLPVEDRRALALALVQRGLDQIGATCDGRVLYPLGGHCQGRKALVIFAGHVLKVEAFADPSAFFPNAFQEDRGYPTKEPSAWWFGEGWTAGWAFAREAPVDGRMLAQHPSTWGLRDAPNHDTWNWMFAYYGQVVPSQVGTALAMVLMGREREMGPMVQAVRQFMQGPPAAAEQALQQAGHQIPWGKDYAVPIGFCATAWKLYGR